MARLGVASNTAANKTYGGEATGAYNTAQGDIGQFNTNVGTLEKGGNVAANPWQNPAYLSNVNRLQSGALNAEANAGQNQIAQLNRRTGGMNNTAAYGAQQQITQNTQRLADQLSAERAASDYNKNVQYQMGMATLPLAGAQAEAPFYGSSVQGQGDALRNLTSTGIASYGPWNAVIQGITRGAAA